MSGICRAGLWLTLIIRVVFINEGEGALSSFLLPPQQSKALESVASQKHRLLAKNLDRVYSRK